MPWYETLAVIAVMAVVAVPIVYRSRRSTTPVSKDEPNKSRGN